MKIKETWNKIKPFTFLNSFGMGLLKIIVAGITRSKGLFISSFYNFFVSITKRKALKKDEKSGYKKYSMIGVLIIIASILFINYSIAVMQLHLTSSYHMYVALLISAITFTDIVLAIIGIVSAKKQEDLQKEMQKYVNLSTALISLSLTQTAILSFTNVGEDLSKWNGIVGMVFGSLTCIIGMYMVVNGIIKQLKENKSEEI